MIRGMEVPSASASGAIVARLCLISGRVQGVYYRASAAERARSSGITGHARNLEDGRVEVLACGPEQAVEAFIAWLWVGPSAAKVTGVITEVAAVAPHELPRSFRTG